MSKKQALEQNFPSYLGIAGTVFTLIMFLVLLNATGWKGSWQLVMALFIVLGGAATWFVRSSLRHWSGLALIISGLGAFFSFMLSYADDPTMMGTNYPLVLFAIAPLCVAGLWLAVEQTDDAD